MGFLALALTDAQRNLIHDRKIKLDADRDGRVVATDRVTGRAVWDRTPRLAVERLTDAAKGAR